MVAERFRALRLNSSRLRLEDRVPILLKAVNLYPLTNLIQNFFLWSLISVDRIWYQSPTARNDLSLIHNIAGRPAAYGCLQYQSKWGPC